MPRLLNLASRYLFACDAPLKKCNSSRPLANTCCYLYDQILITEDLKVSGLPRHVVQVQTDRSGMDVRCEEHQASFDRCDSDRACLSTLQAVVLLHNEGHN